MASETEIARCELCGEPMPAGEEMFKFHGYSGDCPKPPLATIAKAVVLTKEMTNAAYNKGKELGMTGGPKDFAAVIEAALRVQS